jgi:hypothetical protein
MENRQLARNHPGIRIDRIPVDGLAGLLFTVASLLVFLAVPEVRGFIGLTLLGGIPVAGLIYFWRNQTRW